MIAFLNGRFVSEAEAVIPIADRGFLYGDGLFETLRVSRSCPLWWIRHMERLQHAAELLRIELPMTGAELRDAANELVQRNALPESVLRITVSRGSGPRGYSIKGALKPTVALTLHPRSTPPKSLRLATATVRLPAHDPLTAVKSANKLPQILARAEAEERGADEALLLNVAGDVAEASSSNLFWIESEKVFTPPVSDGALCGVARSVLIDLCRQRGVDAIERSISRAVLLQTDGVFLTSSASGIVPIAELDAQKLAEPPLVTTLQDWLLNAEENEAATNQRPA